MMDRIDMKRLHQGCGESLQSNFPYIPRLSSTPVPETAQGRRGSAGRSRSEHNHRRNQGDDR